ncbi:hypothetical protein P5V15_014120 [Pogonomyrmex californicus]
MRLKGKALSWLHSKKAFEKVTLWERKHSGIKSSGPKERIQQQKADKSGRYRQHKTSHNGKKNCFNCGLPDHLGKNCPTKENGPKYFQCEERGHIAAKCPKKKQEVKDSCIATHQAKCTKKVASNKKEIANESELPEVFQINLEHEDTNKIDVTHVPNNVHRLAVKNIVDNYCPQKIKEVGVKMTIILKDEEPIYQRPEDCRPKNEKK